MTADMVWQINYGRYSAADMLQTIYYGKYITAVYYLRLSLFSKLDLDTCPTSEAKNWTDLNHSLQLNVWVWSGAKIEGSGPNSIYIYI